MKTQREIIYSIIEYISGFQITDDNPYSEDLIAKKVDDVRATLIKQEKNEKGSVSELYYQIYKPKIFSEDEKEKYENEEFKNFYVEFPAIMTSINWDNIKYLGKKGFRGKYNRLSMDGFNSSAFRRYNSTEVYYTVVESTKAYIKNESSSEDILMLALFQTPSDIANSSYDIPYPVPDTFKLEMIVKQDVAAALGIPADEKSDARHNREQLTGQQ